MYSQILSYATPIYKLPSEIFTEVWYTEMLEMTQAMYANREANEHCDPTENAQQAAPLQLKNAMQTNVSRLCLDSLDICRSWHTHQAGVSVTYTGRTYPRRQLHLAQEWIPLQAPSSNVD